MMMSPGDALRRTSSRWPRTRGRFLLPEAEGGRARRVELRRVGGGVEKRACPRRDDGRCVYVVGVGCPSRCVFIPICCQGLECGGIASSSTTAVATARALRASTIPRNPALEIDARWGVRDMCAHRRSRSPVNNGHEDDRSPEVSLSGRTVLCKSDERSRCAVIHDDDP